MSSLDGWSPVRLDVPLARQVNWCSCGLAAITMAMRHHAVNVTEKGMESHPLVTRGYLQKYGFNPGRLGRIALSFGFHVTLIDPDLDVVGRKFVEEGGRWVRRDPRKRDLYDALKRNVAPVVCIPNKREAFEGSNSAGSHWITLHTYEKGEFVFHDPAPWRKATRCKPGYWDGWRCSAILISPK
jgi:hypothetical protein